MRHWMIGVARLTPPPAGIAPELLPAVAAVSDEGGELGVGTAARLIAELVHR